jgi:hypothetical protein
MGAPQGGVWKTTDGGLTWQPLTDYWQFLQVACIAVHPTNPNILYVGTGDFQGWMRPFSQGIMRSTDGGQTWQQLGATVFGNRCVSDILIDPENPSIIVACTGWGPYYGVAGDIWRSTDGGETWTRVSSVSAIWSDLAISARDPSTGAVNIVGLNATLGITQFYAAAFHPTDPTRFGIIRRVFCLWNAGARHNPRRNNAKQRDTLDCVCRSTFRSRRGN